ncbi:hypothetical protein [Clostridium intestinale]|uniref:Uncharacterized protein n=1 Tax=Clostridium intestinale TaxID=36845 RepID=A0A7D6ZJ89_9CLOT|nr:hypothetical protein [Clostridium intestinale]QLY81941.1 hypothetical protein HZF06_10250 [Clostridium intestinale]
MATLNMGNSNIIGISYNEMNKMKSNLKRSQQMLETSQRNVSTARVQLQVDRGRLRATEDSLSSIYTEASKRKTKIDKMCSNIDYTIRRFKEVDSRCAQRIKSIGNIYNTKTSLFDKIKNVMISLGRYLFGGGNSLLNEGQDAFNNLGSSNSNGYYSFIGRGAGVENYSAMANSQYSMGGLLLAGTNMFAFYANKYPTIGMNYSGAGGGKVDNEDNKEDGYIWRSIKQVLLGNYTDEHTGLGTVGQIALGFTGIDFLADGRDLVYDFTNWSWTWDHGKQTAFDMIALMPIIGVSKNIKNATKYADLEKDVLKNSEKLIDGIKPIEKGADITKGVSKANPEKVVNALSNYESKKWIFDNEEFMLDKSGMKHILERHHPEYWEGSVKSTQTFLDKDMSIDDITDTISEVLKQNREMLIKKGTNGMYQIEGTINGVTYVVGLNKGRVGQFYKK